MTEGLTWGFPVIAYLFLAGLGAGALTVSASMFLRGGDPQRGMHVDTARYGAFLAPVPIIIGCGFLILELGSFEAGHMFRFFNLYLVMNLSPMSVGTWLLTACIIISLAYAYTYLKEAPGLTQEQRYTWRRLLSWIAIPFGIATAVYTGILLGAMPARPFWNSPILAMLFLLSSLSTGVAAILLLRALFPSNRFDPETERQFNNSGYILTSTDTMLIGFELLVIFLFVMFAHLTVGNVKEAVSVILAGGQLANWFWFGVVIVGLLLPALIELYYVIPRLVFHGEFVAPRGMEIVVPIAILIGGFMLRYVVVVAGQITGPIGL
ncbi:MAG: polysulfide reductase NrfD [Alphaproteobacteria bacterium]|nr:polysulfide reductase NrfD [Alphaproteobacteria bacterium]MDP7429496.1 polysulfide reductase NrfD [Alphaproteobacteria bacterium]